MSWRLTAFVIALLLATGICGTVALLLWRRRHNPGGLPLVLLLSVGSIWSFAVALEAVATDIPTKIIWSKIEYLGAANAGLLFVLFAAQYTHSDRWLTRRSILLLTIIPVVTLIFAITNEWHHWLWNSFILDSSSGDTILIYGHGQWFYVTAIYSYALAFFGMLIMVRFVIRSPGVYRLQTGAMLIGALGPLMSGAMYLLGIGPLRGLNTSPLAFGLTGIVIAWAVYRYQFLDLAPIARDMLVEQLADGVVVTDWQDRVVDVNPAARRILGKNRVNVGQRLELPGLVSPQSSNGQAMTEFVTEQDPACFFDVNPIPLYEHNHQIGRLIVLHDVTERRRFEREQALAASEKRFRALIEHSADAITLMDADGKIGYGSPQAAKIAGVTVEELVGKNVFELVHPDDLNSVREVFSEIRVGTDLSVPFQIRFQHPNGDWRWIEGVVTNLLTEPIVGAVLANYRDITDRKQDETKIQEQMSRLASLHEIDIAINGSFDLRIMLDAVLKQTISRLNVDAADILLLNPYTQVLEYAVGRGFKTANIERSRLRLGEGHAGRAALERRTIVFDGINETGFGHVRTALFSEEKFVAHYCVPLTAKGQVKGVLELFHRSRLNAEGDWLEFMETLATQASIALDNANMFENLQRSHSELALAYDATIEGWARALDLRERGNEGHSRRVAEETVRLGRAEGMSEEELIHLRRGAFLHDIGMMCIPEMILKSTEPSEAEMNLMRQHPVFGFELLSPIRFLSRAADIPYCHHEKWDGTGFPRGLKGSGIPLPARLFAVVDVWDELQYGSPHRDALPNSKALEYICSESGKHFDPHAVDVFVRLQA